MNCGDSRQVRPSMGSWVTYGLGTENQNLPGFIAMCPGGYPITETQNWQAAFLPGIYQGTLHRHAAHRHRQADREHPQLDSSPCQRSGGSSTCSRNSIAGTWRNAAQDRQLEARIHSFELAYRMQTGGDRRVRRQPRTEARPRIVRPGRPSPANSHRPAVDRTRRALRAALARARATVGQPRRHRRQSPQAGRAMRSRDRRAADRSQAARPVRRDAGHLGRRIRSHADGRTAAGRSQRRQDQWPRSQPLGLHACGWPAAACAAGTFTARPTNSASRRSKNESTSTTCTPRCCTCLGFDHTRLTYRYAGRDFRLTDVHGNLVRELLA